MVDRLFQLRIGITDAILAEFERHSLVLVLGETGLGQSHELRAVQSRLGSAVGRSELIDCALPGAAERVAAMQPHRVLLLDHLERAGIETLRALKAFVDAGGHAIGALEISELRNNYSDAVEALVAEDPSTLASLEHAVRIRLEPFGVEQIADLAHRHAQQPLDSATVGAIQQLSLGRPHWALDLLTIAESGQLVPGPRPSIRHDRLHELNLPAMQAASRLAHGLDSQTLAAAAVLSELDPLDQASAEELTGGDLLRELTDRGIAIQYGSSDLLHVPEFIAVPLRSTISSQELEVTRQRITEGLLSLEMLGLPLSDRDAEFCARTPLSSEIPRAAQAAVLHRVLEQRLTFGVDGLTRALFLRAGALGQPLDPQTRVRALAGLKGAPTGLSALVETAIPAEPMPRLAHLNAWAVLSAESGVDPSDPHAFAQLDPAGSSEAATALVLSRLNDTEPLGSDRAAIAACAASHPSPEVACAAGILQVLDAVPRGALPTRSLAAAARTLTGRMGLPESRVLHHLHGSILLGWALNTLFTDTLREHAEDLRGVARRLPAGASHLIWLGHLEAAAGALSAGDAHHALLEWQRMEQRLPMFLPERLTHTVALIARALTAENHRDRAAPSSVDTTFTGMVGYLAGRLEALDPSVVRIDIEEQPAPLVAIAAAHRRAFDQQNPVELFRIAEHLCDGEHWAAAENAASAARRIQLKRRASGAVGRCDRLLERIDAAITLSLPWRMREQIPRPTQQPTRTPLTARERAAAELAAQGLANREIAERMGCGVRTVESHIAQARAKLGAANRSELVERLAQEHSDFTFGARIP